MSPGNDDQAWLLGKWPNGSFFTAYSRPTYGWYGNTFEKYNLTQDDSLFLIFSGSRWLGIVFNGTRLQDAEFWKSTATGESLRNALFCSDKLFNAHDLMQLKVVMGCSCHV